MFCIRRNNRILLREMIGIYDYDPLKHINILYDITVSQQVINIVITDVNV